MAKWTVSWVIVALFIMTLGGHALSATSNAVGRLLPDDAAPPDQQVLAALSQPATTLDFFVSVYKRPSNIDGNSWSDVLSTPLVRLDKNFNLVPAAAKSWDVSNDGLTWTFHLDRTMVWSDGTPLTADDFVATFRLGADPKYAWDFAWFFSPIKGWDDAVKGAVPTEQIGVRRGGDPYTLTVTTKAPAPYVPGMMLYSQPLNARALARSGPFYNSDPKTSVSSGPYVVQEWTKDQRIVLVANPKYRGTRPYIQKIVVKFADLNTEFQAYQANEVDVAANFSPADLQIIENDPALRAQYHQGFGDFRTYYLGFDTMNPPFNNLKVRQAFSHAVDREGLIKGVIKRQGIAAYGMLMPGFPGSHQDDLKPIQSYDPALAKSLLAEAGFSNGTGFPKLELWLREERALGQAVGSAIAAMLKQNLGVQLEVSNKERKFFMDSLNSHKLQFYIVSYGMDFLDPANMLGIWVSGGRHAWKNDRFDELVNGASSLIGNPQKRMAMFHDAEKLLVSDVGFIPIYFVTPGFMWKPYLKGDALAPDRIGVTAWHWPGWDGLSTLHESIYITRDVSKYRR
jgi:oligopeptide transport system substrate-binding protein